MKNEYEILGKPDISITNLKFEVLCKGKPCICFNQNLKFFDCNESFLKTFQVTKKELEDANLTELGVNIPFVNALKQASAAGAGIYKGEFLLGEQKKMFLVDTVFFNIKLDDTSEMTTICQFKLIKNKELQQIESPLIETKPEIKSSANLNALVSVHSLDGKSMFISPLVESILGYTPEELSELNSFDLVYPDDANIVIQAIDKLYNGHDYVNSIYRMIRKDGTVIPVESSSYLISDSKGSNKQIVNVTIDRSYQNEIERALHLSEIKYFSLLMKLPSGVSLIDKTGKILEMNESFGMIMGIPDGENFLEKNFFQVHEFAEIDIIEKLQECLTRKTIVEGEFYYTPENKQRTYLTYSFIPVPEIGGELNNVLACINDITEFKKAEIKSRGEADFLNLAINTVTLPFFVKDEHHRWVMLNNAAVEMMGSAREQLIGKSDYDLYPKDQADVFWQYDEYVLKNGSSINEEQITWSDGSIHDVVTNKQLYTEQHTGKRYIVGTIHDITSYKKIEAELRESEQNYRELFDNSRDFIIIIDFDGNILQANRTYLTHHQLDIETLRKHNVNEFILNTQRDFWQNAIENLLAGTLEDSFDLEILSFKGENLIYEIKPSLLKQGNKPIGVQCILSDVTDRRMAQKRLEQYNMELQELNSTKDKFFSIIAHDLRNPYNSQIGFTELLLEDLEHLSKDEIRESLKIIRNSAKNSYNLLENLLAWSRLQTGRMPFDPENVSLLKITDEVVNILYSLAYRKKIAITNTIDAETTVIADSNMLTSIVNNLVMNAIKYTPIGGEIFISTGSVVTYADCQEKFIEISVTDSGIGIDEEVTKKLFSGEKPVSSPGTAKEGGTGLGLTLVREMIEKHRGKLSVKSNPGGGSVLTFTLPVLEK